MTEKQRIIVFGATGNAGPFVVQRAVDDGHDVCAFVRTPSRLSEELRKKIQIVQGDALDAEAVSDAIKDKDVVLCLLGTGSAYNVPTTMMSEGTKNIVAGMRKHGVKKLIEMMAVSTLPNAYIFFYFRPVAEDHLRVLKFLKEECDDIDWVTVHTPAVQRTSKINPGYWVEKNVWTGRLVVTAGEVADVMMKSIGSAHAEYRHCQFGICSGPARISTFQLKALATSVLLLITGVIIYKLNIF